MAEPGGDVNRGAGPDDDVLKMPRSQGAGAWWGCHSDARTDSRYGVGEAGALLYTSHGGGLDRSCLDATRGIARSGAPMAAPPRAVSHGWAGDRETTRVRCA